MKDSAKHLELLDYLRGVAILAVLLFHSLSTVYGYDVLPWNGWLRGFSVPDSFWCFLPISIFNVGVPVFFVVSGFCIHLSFHQQGQQWRSFFIRRLFRICPAYLAALLFFILFYMHHFRLDLTSGQVWTQLLAHSFFVHNFSTSTIGAVNGSFWSMAVEFQLYLIYPALVFLVGKFGWRRALTVLAAIEILIRATSGLFETTGLAETAGGHISWLFFVSPLGYWFSWALGAALADAFLKKQPLPFLKLPLKLWFALVFVSYFVRPLDDFRFMLFALITATVISRGLSKPAQPAKTPATTLLALQKIGLWSYSIYLLHQPLLNVYSYAINWLIAAENRPALLAYFIVLLTWTLVIPLSFFWYQLIELPGIALGKRFIEKFAGPTAAKPARLPIPPVKPAAVVKNHLRPRVIALLLLAGGSFWVGIQLMPVEPAANNNLAWTLATDPEPQKRNGNRAVELAEDACRQTQYKQAIMVGTLAAAYAEAGRFEDAISAAQNACALAAQNGETNLLQRNLELLARYQDRQPYHAGSAVRENQP
jgi:peptidoglycan/LPS O-acetylase OafA/YrhL